VFAAKAAIRPTFKRKRWWRVASRPRVKSMCTMTRTCIIEVYCIRRLTNAVQLGRPVDQVFRSLHPVKRASTQERENAGLYTTQPNMSSTWLCFQHSDLYNRSCGVLCSQPRKNYLRGGAVQTPSKSHCGIAPALSEAQAGHMSWSTLNSRPSPNSSCNSG
jgi:hypothetical protein